MRSLKSSLLSTIVLLLLITPVANAYLPVINLGAPFGWRSCAYSINDSGQIVGSMTDPFGNEYAALFDPTGESYKNIAPIDSGSIIPGRMPSCAYSINNNNQVVGYSRTTNIAGVAAFLFDTSGAGGGTNLGYILPGPLPPTYPSSIAYGINNNGCIVGQSTCDWVGMTCHEKACRFYGGIFNVNLGTLGGNFSYAYSINNDNLIVGQALTSSQKWCASLFDYSGNGENINLGTLAGCDVSLARSINNLNQIVGYAYGEDISTAVLFNSSGNGANIDLGGLDNGYDKSIAYCINDNSQIVGWAVNGSSSAACLFDPTGEGNNTNLNSLIDPASGWTLERAFCINNNGWIVGQGINPSGQTHAFLLTPEPASILLFTLGGVTILRKRRS
jgi:uncharacterized membrane protein